MKKCSKCKKWKKREEFNKNKTRTDGVNTFCRKCMRIYTRKHYYNMRYSPQKIRDMIIKKEEQIEVLRGYLIKMKINL